MQSIPTFSLLATILSLSPKISGFMGISVGVGVWIPGNAPPPASTDNVEYIALQSFKSSISDDPNAILSSWSGPNICSYKGIFCSDPPEPLSSASLVVAIVDLNRANLAGTLTPDLSLLSHLSALHLNSNRFCGSIPLSLSNLEYLYELDLSNNLFSGPFPSSTLQIPNLIYLDLRFNSFSGQIPDELFQNPNLDAIFLNNNQFQGEIPDSLWSSSASAINLANNQLTGSIPASFGYSEPGLKEILLPNNRLTGCIPEGVGYVTGMQVLDLSFNSLTGHLPDSISCLDGIEVLNIAHNKLSGDLPEVVCDLRNLLNLTVSYNFFSGVSDDCTRLLFRNVGFDLAGNCIPGRDLQRPAPECDGTSAGGLSCLRVPGMRPAGCGGAGGDGMSGLPYFFRVSVP
ncbi:leucine-rich repeat extensin-like protein 2 [Dendrobium catenatum]|uniref:leucine-rich repeat extensin-like protein 2 n=1 Tax=Dendrobium catenatum TaxID=906689 RepID=UPI0009F3D5D3|nr:leucine-rich repeat extensin-like protein 2 [Dendrobium catenatum]